MRRGRLVTIMRHDLRQLRQSPDFWVPMALMALLFFIVLPTALLMGVTYVERLETVQQVGEALGPLREIEQETLKGQGARSSTAYGLAVYLFAPLAVVVPMTISSAIGANTLVGEREKGTGEFLAHSPASEREIYLGKLLASLIPGYLTTLVGFGIYSLLVNTIVGPQVGGWFFPTGDWWLLMFWIIPPFLCLGLTMVLRVSGRVKSAPAAQQASGLVTLPLILLSYAQSSVGETSSALVLGAVAWVAAIWGLARGARAVSRARLLGVDVG